MKLAILNLSMQAIHANGALECLAMISMQKIFRWQVVLLILLLVSAFGCGPTTRPTILRGGVFDPPKPAPDFTLTDQNGNPFRLSSTRGKVVLLYFGYTSCPDVCPMTLVDLGAVHEKLGAAGNNVQVIFVTVDPARDTQQVLKQYVTAFDPSFIGLRGTDQETKATADLFGAKFKKTNLPNSALGYAMDHSAFIYVIDRNGQLRETFPFGAARDDILNDVESLLKEGISS